MKKLAFLLVMVMLLAACSKSHKPFNYRGLPLTLSTSQFIDSMQTRGFVIDSAASDSGRTVVFASQAEKYRVLLAFAGEQIATVQENYSFSTNDSTRQLWQEIRDKLEKELEAWPDCPILKDDHKVAKFDASDGLITVILENTYKPTLSVRYDPKKVKE